MGGDDIDLSPTKKAISKFGQFCLINTSQVRDSSGLIVFSSARHKFGERMVNGFYLVKSPYFGKRMGIRIEKMSPVLPMGTFIIVKGKAINAC